MLSTKDIKDLFIEKLNEKLDYPNMERPNYDPDEKVNIELVNFNFIEAIDRINESVKLRELSYVAMTNNKIIVKSNHNINGTVELSMWY